MFDHGESRRRYSSQGLLDLFIGLRQQLRAFLLVSDRFLDQLIRFCIRHVVVILRGLLDILDSLVVQLRQLRVVILINGQNFAASWALRSITDPMISAFCWRTSLRSRSM